MHTDGCEHEEYHNANDSVCDRVPGEHERAESKPGDLRPVKGDGDKTKSSLVSEQLIDNDIVWCNPGCERKVGQSLENPAYSRQ